MTDSMHLIHHFAEDFLFRTDCGEEYFAKILYLMSSVGHSGIFEAVKYAFCLELRVLSGTFTGQEIRLAN